MSAPLIGRGAKHSFHHSTHSIRSLVKASPGSPPPPQCHRSREPASPIPGRRHHPAASRGWVRVSSASGADCRQRPCHRVDALRALSRCNTAVVRRSALHGLAHDVCFDSLSASATKLPTSLGFANSFVSRRATAVDPVRWLLAERCQQCLFKRERPHLCMSSTCGQSLGLFRSVLGVGGRRPLAAAWPVWQSCAGQFHGVHGGHLLAAELAAGSARELTTTADSVSVRPASPGLSPLPHCQAGVLPHGRHSAANATGAYLLPSGRESAGVKGWRSAANCHSRPPGKRACSRQLAERG